MVLIIVSDHVCVFDCKRDCTLKCDIEHDGNYINRGKVTQHMRCIEVLSYFIGKSTADQMFTISFQSQSTIQVVSTFQTKKENKIIRTWLLKR